MTIDQSQINFNVPSTYKLEEIVGEGAYGLVVAGTHLPSGTRVAIKRITPFDHTMFCQRTLREIKLLRHFRHENIISILDLIQPESYEVFNEVYLVQELMETDLHRVIRSQELSDDHCQYFVYQTLRGLKALHSADVLHRDLKPSNLLLNANCDLKICDFGLARSSAKPPPGASDGGQGFMTEYVATRWYRAPEVMLSFQEYTKAIDLWSVGCILAEMINGKPLFPGRDYHHQLSLILQVLGTPTMDDFNEITSQRSKDYLRALEFTRRQDFSAICPKAKPAAVDLLKRTLTFSPSKRITVEEALTHPYVEAYHDPHDEPTAESLKPGFFDFEFHQEKLSRDQWKRMIYDEVQDPVPTILSQWTTSH
ncbi:mitogen-activated protein kinase CPK1 [Cryptococcus neoformans C23]|uniref:Mitogen-activated protein kinase n=2 Tax=Cryptococcus neoformans TaxID=5207 RepID=A0A854QCS0_CRYNE|nr:CMGC/MAPK protein kinase [Cryptococcus neoformans var. grubii H99]AUB25113.1 CMGC/MAPK protein kinase [Cryptococcus neoformans var. grubii]OWZ31393.1 mitogen-activated protein kinase CPK1 [Cryptococcus neoformans var. grubii AD2-60a]OWZ42523.1 mitogen-activated protein kinase CPK1 [Cryptococcus neoformans var. grubii AD1-83a]OWZ43554.1 mitogen-activated protein kinase CPK1 [Cryptococcus neoformans var. grubii C23]OWZ54238.1 mitogen-activated protein kinase CPK1 [Cryptococcus neoformans var.|eukprot:XP_012050197.1 CMGC/MAPK protein kinase [Cryptococcus neoformans var. grubii H99]